MDSIHLLRGSAAPAAMSIQYISGMELGIKVGRKNKKAVNGMRCGPLVSMIMGPRGDRLEVVFKEDQRSMNWCE